MEQIFKGLAGVVVDTSSSSKVRPTTISLTYRGDAVEELCEYRDFLDVAYLLVLGVLPD
jgi:citrate synthase